MKFEYNKHNKGYKLVDKPTQGLNPFIVVPLEKRVNKVFKSLISITYNRRMGLYSIKFRGHYHLMYLDHSSFEYYNNNIDLYAEYLIEEIWNTLLRHKFARRTLKLVKKS